MPASPIRKLMPLADDARRRGVHIYHLNIGQPDIETPAVMRERLGQIHDRVLAYTPSGGTPEYLHSLQVYYRGRGHRARPRRADGDDRRQRGHPVRAARLRERGRRRAGGRAVLHELHGVRDHGGRAPRAPDGAAPRTASTCRRARPGRARSPGTRARCCSATRATRPAPCTRGRSSRRVAAFCRDHGLFLISDEVYREFVYDGAVRSAR